MTDVWTPPCEADPEGWYPEKSRGSDGRTAYDEAIRRAVAACTECRASQKCLALVERYESGHASGLSSRYGIWAGTTPGQRWLAAAPRRHGTEATVRAGCLCAECQAWSARRARSAA